MTTSSREKDLEKEDTKAPNDEVEHGHLKHGKSKKRDKKDHKGHRFQDNLPNIVSSKKKYGRLVEEEEESSEEETKQLTPRQEQREQNIARISPSSDEISTRMASMEERLKRLEDKTQASLYNIEALLRNFIFYQNSGRPGTSVSGSRDGATTMASFPPEYAQGYFH